MKIGSIGYATWQGLGVLMRSFYDAGVVTDVAVVHHGNRTTHTDWYPDSSPQITNLRSGEQIALLREWCKDLDCLLFFETPFIWELIPYCRRIGVKTVLMPMYECTPRVMPYQPDAFLNPSLLDQHYFPFGTYLPVPVDPLPWSRRYTAKTFVHNAGNGGLRGRNGTRELLDAIQYVKSDAQFIIRCQDITLSRTFPSRRNTRIICGTSSRESLYAEGDVFIFPEKFNGLSLPLQEAAASGMVLMTTDRFPNTEHLPPFLPLKVSRYQKACVSLRCLEFDEAILNPKDIAEAIDFVYGMDIKEMSISGLEWGTKMSWSALRPRYMDFFRNLIGGK